MDHIGGLTMRFSLGEMVWIALIAFIGVWLIDKALAKTGAGRFAINSPN